MRELFWKKIIRRNFSHIPAKKGPKNSSQKCLIKIQRGKPSKIRTQPFIRALIFMMLISRRTKGGRSSLCDIHLQLIKILSCMMIFSLGQELQVFGRFPAAPKNQGTFWLCRRTCGQQRAIYSAQHTVLISINIIIFAAFVKNTDNQSRFN